MRPQSSPQRTMHPGSLADAGPQRSANSTAPPSLTWSQPDSALTSCYCTTYLVFVFLVMRPVDSLYMLHMVRATSYLSALAWGFVALRDYSDHLATSASAPSPRRSALLALVKRRWFHLVFAIPLGHLVAFLAATTFSLSLWFHRWAFEGVDLPSNLDRTRFPHELRAWFAVQDCALAGIAVYMMTALSAAMAYRRVRPDVLITPVWTRFYCRCLSVSPRCLAIPVGLHVLFCALSRSVCLLGEEIPGEIIRDAAGNVLTGRIVLVWSAVAWCQLALVQSLCVPLCERLESLIGAGTPTRQETERRAS